MIYRTVAKVLASSSFSQSIEFHCLNESHCMLSVKQALNWGVSFGNIVWLVQINESKYFGKNYRWLTWYIIDLWNDPCANIIRMTESRAKNNLGWGDSNLNSARGNYWERRDEPVGIRASEWTQSMTHYASQVYEYWPLTEGDLILLRCLRNRFPCNLALIMCLAKQAAAVRSHSQVISAHLSPVRTEIIVVLI